MVAKLLAHWDIRVAKALFEWMKDRQKVRAAEIEKAWRLN
jgi:hypothetical protein